MKCKYCGAEMPDDANFCGKCTKPLKDTIPDTPDRGQNIENPAMQTVKQEDNAKKSSALGLISMIIGLVSMALSCVYLGFLGIVGIALGIISLIKKESKKGMAIVGISCSTIALFFSLILITADTDTDSLDKTYQAAEQTAGNVTEAPAATPTPKPTAKPTPTPKPTLSPEEKEEKIQKALMDGKKEELKKYNIKEVNKVAGKLLENLSFQKGEDYDTANAIAKTMISVSSGKLKTGSYKDITSNYKSYVSAKKELSSGEYKEIKKKWKEASEAISQIVSNTFDVSYDIWSNSSGSRLEEILNAITGEMREYKYAYYANGCSYDYEWNMWRTNDDEEYVIYRQKAFPKAGRYSLNLIPTGDTMHVVYKSGFERDIATYTVLSEADEEEYNRIEQLKYEYDYLCDEVEGYKENIEFICESFFD